MGAAPLEWFPVEPERQSVYFDNRRARLDAEQAGVGRIGASHHQCLFRAGHDLAAQPLVGWIEQRPYFGLVCRQHTGKTGLRQPNVFQKEGRAAEKAEPGQADRLRLP